MCERAKFRYSPLRIKKALGIFRKRQQQPQQQQLSSRFGTLLGSKNTTTAVFMTHHDSMMAACCLQHCHCHSQICTLEASGQRSPCNHCSVPDPSCQQEAAADHSLEHCYHSVL